MAASYDEALDELYQAAHESFVSERKRLAAALKAAGDKAGATRLLARGRPPLSAWAVNQLWWQARGPFADLLAASERLRTGDQAAAGDRREALATLKANAASILVQAGHGANEGTLRRVATTLAALAAAGGFDPDAPGALSADRDPPGFDVALLGGAALPAATAPSAAPARADSGTPSPAKPAAPPARAARPALQVVPPPAPAAASGTASTARATPAPETPEAPEALALERAQHAREAAERQAREQAERLAREQAERLAREQAERLAREQAERLRIEQDQKRLEAERAARIAERERLTAHLPALRADLERRQREVERLQAEVRRVSGLAEQARAAIDDAESRLKALGDDG